MSAAQHFATGDWYAVAGAHVSVMLPSSERARVASLWELADAGASADTLLDALLAGGLSQLPSFALIATGDDSTRVIVRGTPTVTVTTGSGEQVISAATGHTWNEQVLTGVTAGRVDLDGDARADHVLTGGLVRVSAVEFGEPATHEWSDRDGQTSAGVARPDFARPAIPGQEIAPSVVPRPVASLVFSTGDVVDVDRTVLVGRAPEARQFASHDQPHSITVASPHQEISSTHLEIRPGAGADHGSAIATDLGSANGTILVQPGLVPEELTPGIAVSLTPGAVLDLGDGVTIQVANPGSRHPGPD